jgi:hypothetical protein
VLVLLPHLVRRGTAHSGFAPDHVREDLRVAGDTIQPNGPYVHSSCAASARHLPTSVLCRTGQNQAVGRLALSSSWASARAILVRMPTSASILTLPFARIFHTGPVLEATSVLCVMCFLVSCASLPLPKQRQKLPHPALSLWQLLHDDGLGKTQPKRISNQEERQGYSKLLQSVHAGDVCVLLWLSSSDLVSLSVDYRAFSRIRGLWFPMLRHCLVPAVMVMLDDVVVCNDDS